MLHEDRVDSAYFHNILYSQEYENYNDYMLYLLNYYEKFLGQKV